MPAATRPVLPFEIFDAYVPAPLPSETRGATDMLPRPGPFPHVHEEEFGPDGSGKKRASFEVPPADSSMPMRKIQRQVWHGEPQASFETCVGNLHADFQGAAASSWPGYPFCAASGAASSWPGYPFCAESGTPTINHEFNFYAQERKTFAMPSLRRPFVEHAENNSQNRSEAAFQRTLSSGHVARRCTAGDRTPSVSFVDLLRQAASIDTNKGTAHYKLLIQRAKNVALASGADPGLPARIDAAAFKPLPRTGKWMSNTPSCHREALRQLLYVESFRVRPASTPEKISHSVHTSSSELGLGGGGPSPPSAKFTNHHEGRCCDEEFWEEGYRSHIEAAAVTTAPEFAADWRELSRSVMSSFSGSPFPTEGAALGRFSSKSNTFRQWPPSHAATAWGWNCGTPLAASPQDDIDMELLAELEIELLADVYA